MNLRIAFDAKRAFRNNSGLGNYSRDTLNILNTFSPDNEYLLYTPDIKNTTGFKAGKSMKIVTPVGGYRKFTGFWRTFGLPNILVKDNVDIFHGLSNEIPVGINKTNIPSTVTVHDLIFKRLPELYTLPDRLIYDMKFKYACNNANRVIAVSNQTKNDIVRYYNTDPEKIEVIYQGCNMQFYGKVSDSEKFKIKEKYNLPSEFILFVGSVEKRKNALHILKALNASGINIPVVFTGKKTGYVNDLQQFALEKNIKNLIFIHNAAFQELPALYQMATLFIYPSVFEGFGIPILEALNSGVPVITSTGSCFEETGGKAARYASPYDHEELADLITRVLNNRALQKEMITEGYEHAKKFRPEIIAQNLINFYKNLK